MQRRQVLKYSLLTALTALTPHPLWAAAKPLTRIAFGSCLDQRRDIAILDTIRATHPDLMLMIGDNVYGDVRDDDPDCSVLKAAYDQLAVNPVFQNLRKATPILATWDDHDYGRNDGGTDWAFKKRAKTLFRDMWNRPVHSDGVYMAQSFGPPGQRTQIILLDTRYNRSPLNPTDVRGATGKERYLPDSDPGKTFLGPQQWNWLEKELRQTADVRLIASSIQVLAEGHGWERWGNFPHERDRLLNLIRAADGTSVLLSGDRHLGAIYSDHGFFEITSSSLNKPFGKGLDEAGPNRIGDVYTEANFGLIDLDWSAHTLTLNLCNTLGQSVRTQTVAIKTKEG